MISGSDVLALIVASTSTRSPSDSSGASPVVAQTTKPAMPSFASRRTSAASAAWSTRFARNGVTMGIQTPEKWVERLTQVSFQQRPDKTVMRGAREAGDGSVKLSSGGGLFRRSSERRNRSPGQTSNGFFALTEPARARVTREGARDGAMARFEVMRRC